MNIKDWEKKFIEEYKNKGWFIASEDQKPIIDFIKDLISQSNQEILDRVEKEVIGKNEDWSRFINRDNQMRAVGRNRLKSSQRQKLEQLKLSIQSK